MWSFSVYFLYIALSADVAMQLEAHTPTSLASLHNKPLCTDVKRTNSKLWFEMRRSLRIERIHLADDLSSCLESLRSGDVDFVVTAAFRSFPEDDYDQYRSAYIASSYTLYVQTDSTNYDNLYTMRDSVYGSLPSKGKPKLFVYHSNPVVYVGVTLLSLLVLLLSIGSLK